MSDNVVGDDVLPAGVMYCAGNTPATPGGIPGTSLLPWVVLTLILLELVTELSPRPAALD